MSWQITLSLPPGLITWTNDELPMNGIEGQEDDYKRRELQPHWVPGGDHESTNERVNERVNEPTSQRTNERTSEQAAT